MALLYRDLMTGTAGNNLHSRASDVGGTFVNYGGGSFVLKTGGGCYASGSARIVAPVDVNDVEIETIIKIMSTGVANNYGGPTLAVNEATSNTYFGQFFNYSTGSLAHWSQINKAGTFTNYCEADQTTDDIYLPVGEHTVIQSREGDMFRTWVGGRELVRVIPSATYLPAYVRGGLFSDGGSATSSTGLHFKQFEMWDLRKDYSQIQFMGDSMTACDYYNPGIIRTPVAQQWPTRVMADLYLAGFVGRWANVGVDGKRLDTMESNATAEPTDVPALTQEVNISGFTRGWGCDVVMNPGQLNAMVVLAGFNDIAQGANAATVISRLQTYVNNRVAAGHQVVVCTLVECNWTLATGGAVSTATGNAIVASVNSAILALSGIAGVVRLDLITELNDYTNATYRSSTDGIHWLPAAQPFVADAVFDVLAGVVLDGTIVISYPTAGLILLTGEVAELTWASANVDNVDIERSIDGGDNYTMVEANVANTGSYDWTPTTDDVSAEAIIRVVDSADGDVFDLSDEFIVATTEQPAPAGVPKSRLVNLGGL